MLIFSVETSCDETSVCIMNNQKNILSHIVYTQSEHAKFGGVIPELASRSHLQILQKISKQALSEANITIKEIDLFCATCGPGLIGGLLVGSIYTKGMALGLNKPFIPINHLEGHIQSSSFNNEINYPFVTLLLTGGHTQIYLVKSVTQFELLGETLDDAIGEAFDKVAKLLGMKYPGGPNMEKKAEKGNENFFNLPIPLKKEKNLSFSFSGIKTAINLIVKNNKNFDQKFAEDMSASFQKTVVNILINKINLTLEFLLKKKIKINQIALVGGVAANNYIYHKIENNIKNKEHTLIKPPRFMLSDNAAMIAWAALQKKPIKEYENINFDANPRLKIK